MLHDSVARMDGISWSVPQHGRCRSMGDAMPRQKIAAGWSEDTAAKSLPPCTERKANKAHNESSAGETSRLSCA